ncbi:hypothetical protein F511_01662 [Dorcoceras hygrometricum]|uniref:Uncharacterized protein n=1 Tax=Dorcoceras hygrometricum TaxID=472368 RepID=A0A2Z7C1H7_9LAMI|nr:hypothetical protein F511_01662 [Dorcoceras hygrometricum]
MQNTAQPVVARTHEIWELPTPLIVANRSQQGDEVYGSYPLVIKTSILGPSAHHSSMVDTQIRHHSDDSVGLFGHDTFVGHSQRGSQSGHKSINLDQDLCMNAIQ